MRSMVEGWHGLHEPTLTRASAFLLGRRQARVLTLSTLFPNAAHPTLGCSRAPDARLAARPDVELEVVAPVGLPVWPLSLHPHYAPLRRLPRQESWKGLVVHRPPTGPGRGSATRTAQDVAEALLPMMRELRARFAFDVIDANILARRSRAMRLAEALGCLSRQGARQDIFPLGRARGRRQVLAAGRQAAA